MKESAIARPMRSASLDRGESPARARAPITPSQSAGVVRPAGKLASAVIVTVLTLSLFGPVMSQGAAHATGEGSPVRQLLYIASFALALVCVKPWLDPRRMLVVPVTMAIALAWCWLSVGWAFDPGIALRRLVLTTIVVWTVFLAVEAAGTRQTITLMRATLAVVLLANFVAVFLFPGIGRHLDFEAGDAGLMGLWRGVLGHKNFAGAATAVTILLFVFDAGKLPRWLRWGTVVLSAIFLFGTQSKTSMGIVVLAIAVGYAFQFYRPAYRLLLFPVAIVALVAIAWFTVTIGIPAFDSALNDPNALTGRGEIWPPMLRFIVDHPMTGAGYGNVWNVGDAREPINDYAMGWVTTQTSAHNGYIDLAAQVGIPGLILGLLALFAAPLGRLLTPSIHNRERAGLCAAILVFGMGHNLTESSLIERDIIMFVFIVFAIALIRMVGAESITRRVA